MTADAVEVATVDGGTAAVAGADLAALAGTSGAVVRPGDAGWDEAVLIWNGMVARTPALVVQPSSAEEVAAAVRFAAERRLLLGVKGGGHNIAGTAIAPGGLVLDMARMREVSVDADGQRAAVGPGCRLRDVDGETQRVGLAAVLGFVSETGVAGLTLGGGFGYLTRKHGWTVDSLEEVEIVTADGEVRVASRTQEPELFWALRGGGGNLGVVTRFTFRLFEVGPMITGGLVAWDGARAGEVIDAYRRVTAAAPRELTMALALRLAPPAPFVPPEWHGKPIVAIIVCHHGEDPGADLAELRALGDPIFDLVTEKPYAAQQAMLDATQPKGLNYYWKTEFVAGLPDGFVDAFRAGGGAVTSPMSQGILFHLAGALNEAAPDDGAVGNRDAAFVTGFAACWPPGDPRAGEHQAWARGSWEGIRPFSTGGNYVNFQVADDPQERTVAAYGPNYERLRQVKEAYDPANLFRVNRNVAPSASG